jgi:hypothetical protein
MPEHTTEHARNAGEVMTSIHEGMPVYDREGKKIGKVKAVYMGTISDSLDQSGAGPAAPAAGDVRYEDRIVPGLSDIIAGDNDIPEEVRARMEHSGFIQIDSVGLFARDRYALREHIESAGDEGVRLKITRDGLI